MERMTDVSLRAWSTDDLDLLRRNNAPELMAHLGGPESDDQLLARHARYLRGWEDGSSQMYAIVTPEHPEGVGAVGFWSRDDGGRPLFEVGWTVQTAFQGRGYARAALAEVITEARRADPGRAIAAYPRVDNDASNALCRRAGFVLERVEEFEFPKGTWLPSNVWVLPALAPGTA